MKDIIISVATLGGFGALFGVLLGVFNERFKVEENPLSKAIYDVLPHGECGACGFPGCFPCAEAIAENRALLDVCTVGGQETAKKVKEVLENFKKENNKQFSNF
jgi:electron transport complex protein RnfB